MEVVQRISKSGGNSVLPWNPPFHVGPPGRCLAPRRSHQAGRINGIRKGEVGSSDSFLSTASYWANGAPASMQMGNGVIEETVINSLQQIGSISAKRDGTTLWRSDLTYSPTANNGNITTQTISGTHAGGAFSFAQTYEYDTLNRLSSVLDSGVGAAVDAKSQIFIYDRYSNRALKQNSFKQGGAVEVPQPTAAAVEAVFPGNRLNNCCDAAGDTGNINGRALTYDGEHRVRQVMYTDVTPATITLNYFYDGDGRRVRSEKRSNGALVSATNFVYDASGQLMAEYTTPTPTTLGRQYLTQDHLGTTRLVTKATGTAANIVYSRHDFMPFGEEIARGVNDYGPSALSLKFTGKERDGESGLDYFQARYMSAALGRFTSADDPLVYADTGNPQSWNLFSYGLNNPVLYIDPDGHEPCVDGINPENGNICTVATARAPARESDVPIENPFFYAVVEGTQRARGPVTVLAVGTAAVVSLPAVVPAATTSTVAVIDGVAYTWESLLALGPQTLAALAAAGKISQEMWDRLQAAVGPLSNWVRIGSSWSNSLQQKISVSIRWGASPAKGGKYLDQIGSPTLRSFNQWVRAQRIPLPGWRFADSGHLHLKK
jgi:RHS repeat-associated protein